VVWALERIAAELKPAAGSLTSFDPAADPEGRALDAALSLGVAMVQTIAAAAERCTASARGLHPRTDD
jgi:hypothetical protein